MTQHTSAFRQGLRDLFPPASPRSAQSKPTMVFDPEKCTGCGLCQTVCAQEKGQPRITLLRDACAGTSFAIFCQHCLEPNCVKACPNAALSKGPDGIVRQNAALCVNCGLCLESCPEGSPLRTANGKIVKCDLCEGHPACVSVCPTGALTFTKGKNKAWIAPLRWLAQTISFLLLVVVLIGSVCSLNLMTFDISCPFGVLQNVFSAKAILLTTIVAALLLMALSFIFGRAFCGWICPFGFVLDLVDAVIPHNLFRLPSFLRKRNLKHGVALGSLAAAAATGSQAFCAVCPIGSVCRSYGLNSVMAQGEAAIVPALAALNLGEKRTFCRYFCPVGATLGLAAKIGLVRIEIGANRCKKFSCMRCAEVCPTGIIPREKLAQGVSPDIDMSECITCLRCVGVCPHQAARIRFFWQKKASRKDSLPMAAKLRCPHE